MTENGEAVRPAAGVSDAELEVLKVLWDQGPGTVRQVLEALRAEGRSWAYTTVMTLLHRLCAKGYATSDASAPAHVFHASASRESLVRRRLEDVADELCDGSPAPLVLSLMRSRRFTAEEIAHFRRLLDELESPRDPGRSRPRSRS
jgi:BlaI family penicillinase repressor